MFPCGLRGSERWWRGAPVGAWLGLPFFLRVGRVFLSCPVFVPLFVVGVCLIVAGFHVGVRGKAAGRVVRCGAKPGGCRLTGADGGPVPHFASVAEGEAFLAEQESAQRGGFTGSSGDAGVGVRDAFAPDCGFVVDAAGRFYRDNGEDVTSVCGVDIAQWGSSRDDFVDVIDGGGSHALNADTGSVDTVARVNGGVVEGDFSAEGMFGVRLDEVTGDVEIGGLNGLVEADGTVRQSRITLVSGDASVSRVGDYSAIGRVTGGNVWAVSDGGLVHFVSHTGRVDNVLSGGRVGAVEGGGVVNLVNGKGATVGLVDGGDADGASGGVVRRVSGGGSVETVTGRGVVEIVGAGGDVDVVDGNGSVRLVTRGGHVEHLLGASSLDVNEGVVGFVGSPTAPTDGNGGAVLADNRAGGRVECVRAGGVVDENLGEVDTVLSGGVVNGLRGGGEVGSLLGRVGYLGGPDARVRSMGGSEGAWAEISLVRCSASVNEGDEMRVIPAVGFVSSYSRINFETSNAEEALACIGRVDRGALEAGLVDIRYRGRDGESLVPLLMEREGVSVEE